MRQNRHSQFNSTNAMAIIAHHNELMIDLDKKCTMLFLCGMECYSYTQLNCHML